MKSKFRDPKGHLASCSHALATLTGQRNPGQDAKISIEASWHLGPCFDFSDQNANQGTQNSTKSFLHLSLRLSLVTKSLLDTFKNVSRVPDNLVRALAIYQTAN